MKGDVKKLLKAISSGNISLLGNTVQRKIRMEENIHNFHILMAIHKYFLAELFIFSTNKLKLLPHSQIFSY